MAGSRTPGPVCGHARPQDVNDGTNARTAMPAPGPVRSDHSWSVIEYARRVGYVEDAWARCRSAYAQDAIVKQVGEDAWGILSGIVVGLLMALGVLIVTAGVGAVVGGAIGSLGAGVGAVPGAVAGADIGLTVGEGILAWAGLGFLIVYVADHLKEMGGHFRSAIRTAWTSHGDPATIDCAAREFADGVGYLVSILLQALVLFLTKSANSEGAVQSLGKLRDSLLFKHCPKLEPWLLENYPKLRAKYVPLRWSGPFEEGPLIPNTSIPESMKLKVGDRMFEIVRNKEKIGPDGRPIGPATKHLGERAQVTEGRPALEQATRDMKQGLSPQEAKRVAGPENWPKSEWSKASQTDFPISSLAAALDQAEAQLMFQPPAPNAKPVGLDHWELIIDTTRPIWRVYHAEYKPNPKW